MYDMLSGYPVQACNQCPEYNPQDTHLQKGCSQCSVNSIGIILLIPAAKTQQQQEKHVSDAVVLQRELLEAHHPSYAVMTDAFLYHKTC